MGAVLIIRWTSDPVGEIHEPGKESTKTKQTNIPLSAHFALTSPCVHVCVHVWRLQDNLRCCSSAAMQHSFRQGLLLLELSKLGRVAGQ